MRAVIVLALAACTPKPVERIANPAEGVSIMVYAKGDTGFGVVDDRRWIEVDGPRITLDRIDEAAPLPALVIEPISGPGRLAIGACARERIDASPAGLQRLAQAGVARDEPRPAAKPGPPAWDTRRVRPVPAGVLSPLVRCTVTGPHGRYLVRVLYVAPGIRYRGQHDVELATEDKASITTRFALVTPAWGIRAAVALFDGLPGTDEPAREVAHGTVVLDGGTAVLAIPTQTVTARLRRIYDGAVRDRETPDTDLAWGRESRRAVWVWLELDGATLSTGPVRAHVALPGQPVRDLVVSAIDRELVGTTLRLPLWVDETLFGLRRHTLDRDDDRQNVLSQRFDLSVSNAGDAPREVWIEEHLRPARRFKITRARPARPTVIGNIARMRVVVPPRGTERTTFTITYAQ